MTNATSINTKLDDETVAIELLDRLRAECEPNLQYSDTPSRVLGGYETQIYSFSVTARSKNLAGPLIVRIFSNHGSAQAQREAVFQNTLAGLGYPVPRVVLCSSDQGIMGRPFNVMELVPGHSMMANLVDPTADITQVAQNLALYHSRLHRVPVGPVMQAIETAGISTDPFSIRRQVDKLDRYLIEPAFERYEHVGEWLKANRPEDRESPVVCHGDFHPGNIMVDGSRVTGIIDWPGAVFADPEYDVATALALIVVVAGSLFPEWKPVLSSFGRTYVDEYLGHSPLDRSKIEYFEVMKCYEAVLRGVSQGIPGIAPELLPREGDPWAHPEALKAAVDRIREITNLELPLPDGI